jgi:hypothetical protein
MPRLAHAPEEELVNNNRTAADRRAWRGRLAGTKEKKVCAAVVSWTLTCAGHLGGDLLGVADPTADLPAAFRIVVAQMWSRSLINSPVFRGVPKYDRFTGLFRTHPSATPAPRWVAAPDAGATRIDRLLEF